jgi:hypothetical protein
MGNKLEDEEILRWQRRLIWDAEVIYANIFLNKYFSILEHVLKCGTSIRLHKFVFI